MSSRRVLIEAMLQTHPEDPFLHYALALEWQKEGEMQKAIDRLQELKSLKPDYLALYYQLGKMYEAIGNNELAVDSLIDGKRLAKKMGDIKAAGEISEALMMHDIFD